MAINTEIFPFRVQSTEGDRLVTPAEIERISNPAENLVNVVELTSNYTAQASDFETYTHTIFWNQQNNQYDLTMPDNIVPDYNILIVKQLTTSGNSGRILLAASGNGKFDKETDHLITDEEALICQHMGNNQFIIVGDYLFGSVQINNYVSGATFDTNNRNLTLTRQGLTSLVVNIPATTNPDHEAFLSEVTKTGDRFDLSKEVFVNEDNVIIQQYISSGTPNVKTISLARQENTRQTVDLGTLTGVQFTNLVGGKLSLSISSQEISSSGFLPHYVELRITFGSHTFTFPLGDLDPTAGNRTIDIDIDNIDYSDGFDINATAILIADMTGVSFTGSLTIQAVINSLKGTLHDSIVSLARVEANNVELSLDTEIDAIRKQITGDEQNLESIQDRISPYRTDTIILPESGDAYFLNSTGSDAFPSIANMTQATQSNPTFAITGTALFVAVPLSNTVPEHQLSSTLGTTILTSGEASINPNLDLGASETINGVSFGIYRVTGLTSLEIVVINELATRQVVAWADDLSAIGREINKIDHELENPILQVSPEVSSYLKNDVTIDQSSSIVYTPTQYNFDLTSDSDYGVYRESPATSIPVNGITSSNAINGGLVDGRGQKLVVIDPKSYGSNFVLRADAGGTEIELLTAVNNELFANIFVPSDPGGSQTIPTFPTPQNRVPNEWWTIETATPQHRAESNELFFVSNLPSEASNMTFRYRYLANGIGGTTVTQTLTNIGGSSIVDQSYTLSLPDGESMSIRFTWQPQFNRIRIECVPNASNPNFFIFDMQVSLEFDRTVVTPPTTATVHQRQVGIYNPQEYLVFAIKPSITRVDSNSSSVILITEYGEFDLVYSYNTLFGNTDTGNIEINSESCNIYDYHKFISSDVLMREFKLRASLAFNGFFTQQHNYQDVLELDSQVQARDDNNNIISIGTELVLKTPDGNSYYRLSINNSGELVTTEIT